MDELFLRIVNMSFAATVIGAVVLILRAAFKRRLPRWVFCLLWGLVLARLLLPFSLPSPVSAFNAIPAARTVETGNRAAIEFVGAGEAAVDFPTLHTVPAGQQGTGKPVVARSRIPVAAVLAAIWLCGAALLICYSLACYFYTLYRLRTARQIPHSPEIDAIFQRVGIRPKRVRLYLCDLFPSPVVCGLIRPKLVLSGLVEPEDVAHVVTHELTHIRRGDNLWKALATLALYLHWFNPLIWMFYRWYVTDMEASCDEAVVRRPETDRRAYAYSLVNMAQRSRSAFAGGFLAFGECSLKERVKSIMQVKKNTIIITILCVAVVAGLAVVFLTNPQRAPAVLPAADSSVGEVALPADVTADMKLIRGVLDSLRVKDISEMRARRNAGVPESPSAEIPADDYDRVITDAQALSLAWQKSDFSDDTVCIDLLRKDGKRITLTLSDDTVMVSGSVNKLVTRSTYYVYQADTTALYSYALGLLAGAEEPAAPSEAEPQQEEPPVASAAPIAPAASAQEDAAFSPALPNADNPPYLQILYDEVTEVNLIDRDSRTCSAVTDQTTRTRIVEQINLLRPRDDLKLAPDTQGIRLLQIRLRDGTKYEYWCHNNVLMYGETQIADATDLRGLYKLFYEIEQAAQDKNTVTAEWLGYMNAYRITEMGLSGNAIGKLATYKATAAEESRDAILDVAAKLKAVTVDPKSAVSIPKGTGSGMEEWFAIRFDFENGTEGYFISIAKDGRMEVFVDSIGYSILYQTTEDGTLQALLETLGKYSA